MRGGEPPGRSDRTPNRKKDLCWHFNRGKCSYGLNCKFDHRCGVCGKFGHGAHSCRRLGLDKNSGLERGGKQDRLEKPTGDRYHFYASDRRNDTKPEKHEK